MRSRDPYFDNAKLVLVTLVVVGHTWTLLPDAPDANPAYHFLYSFHMPAFVLVTGYLSRSFVLNRRNLLRLAQTVVLPYFVFETLLAGFRTWVGGEQLGTLLYLDPHWPMWYLAALLMWRLVTPLLRKFRQPLVPAVAVSLAGGLLTTDVLALPRATALLPFFVLGLVLPREHFERLTAPAVRYAAVAVLASALVAAVLVANPLDKEWLYWRSGYTELGVAPAAGMLLRTGQLALTAVLALSALALVPRTHRWFTALGSASLVVYLCHGFVVKSALYAGVGGWAAAHPGPAFVVLTVSAVVLGLGLAATPVARRLDPLIDPISVALADTPGVLEPDHQRRQVQRRLAYRTPVSRLL